MQPAVLLFRLLESRFGLPPGEPLPQPPDEATVRAWCTRLRELGIVVANRDA